MAFLRKLSTSAMLSGAWRLSACSNAPSDRRIPALSLALFDSKCTFSLSGAIAASKPRTSHPNSLLRPILNELPETVWD